MYKYNDLIRLRRTFKQKQYYKLVRLPPDAPASIDRTGAVSNAVDKLFFLEVRGKYPNLVGKDWDPQNDVRC